ncbi:PREDICTED: epsin-1-like isoform X4 [Poecilia mexicana]|uniref:epsin-1-like isoform X4 n=1 Tax=Poecilia mexicana TaxID=48701 RepID=UPI00072EB83E|nr:PREDICTED: epsin-1-like isoform X4 [Poecilia mexicana]
MTSSMLRRQLKNLVQNYSEAEVKVREATSNDPWGPSSSQMADISDLTYNAVACSEIMTMLWKRLKDDKNWRHIHKSLTLLEYLLKTGDDRVMLKMKENIYIVKALTEYRFVEKDGKDQGVNVREKAKVVLVLMEDDEKLKEEREFAMKTREKTSKSSAASSTDNVKDPNYKPVYVPGASGLPCLDNIPSVADLTASFAARKEERLRQEAEKKETERRAKMSEDELKWEDAGKAENAASEVWGGEKEEEKKEEVKSDPWGAPKEPSTDPWGAPAKTEDPFVADKTDEDPFTAPKDKEDPFTAPKDKPDPFTAPKDKPDPFTSSNGDPFSAPKEDPFNAPKEDPFSAPKEDPFSAPKDDPFKDPQDDPFNAPKDDPFNTPKDDPFGVPANDPFTAPVSTPPKEEPLVEATISKADSFTGPTTPPKASFSSPTKPVQSDPFGGPTTPGKEDPFSTTSKDDPFAASSSPSKDDLFTVPCSPPTEAASDPFSAPAAGSPQETADTWGAQTSSPPAKGSDAWGAPSVPKETKSADPWGDGPSVSSQLDDSDPFGDATKPDDDPWGAPASAPVSSDDAWGTPAPPSDVSPSGDPFGDGATKSNDPWGAPSNASGDGAGKRTSKEEEICRKTASFLGSTGASLVDVDDLFAPNPKTKQQPLINTLAARTQAIGKVRKKASLWVTNTLKDTTCVEYYMQIT